MIDNEKSNERNGSSRFSRFGEREESKDEENCFPFFENGGHVATLENYATVSLSLSRSERLFLLVRTPMASGCGYKLGFMREIKCALLSKRRRFYRDRGPRYFSTTSICVYMCT